MSKGSKRRPTAEQRMSDANWEIWLGGWYPVSLEPPGTKSAEFKKFYNSHDPDKARLYWRPIQIEKDSK